MCLRDETADWQVNVYAMVLSLGYCCFNKLMQSLLYGPDSDQVYEGIGS